MAETKRINVNIEIVQERPLHYPQVSAVHRSAFGRDDEAELVDALRTSEAFVPELSLVALVNGEVAGHILFTKLVIQNTDGRRFQSLSLAPMGVKKTIQGRGIGAESVNTGLEKARELGYRSVIVLGHAAYYPRFGFEPAGKRGIRPPFILSHEKI